MKLKRIGQFTVTYEKVENGKVYNFKMFNENGEEHMSFAEGPNPLTLINDKEEIITIEMD